MKVKANNLTGKLLDWAVARCEGHTFGTESIGLEVHAYSTDWAQGGPIIDREGISTVQEGDAAEWVASLYDHAKEDWHLHTCGETPLIAAMRCYVMFKLGAELDVPDIEVKL